MQQQLAIPLGDMTLPALILGPLKYAVGNAYCVLREEQTLEITHTERISISPRITVECRTLSSGERIVVLDKRRTFDLPAGVDGVLLVHPTNEGIWIAHNALQAASDEIEANGLAAYSTSRNRSWLNSISYRAEQNEPSTGDMSGLRPPQLGALFAVGSHWSVSTQPATVIMPTGTGKTETMLAVLAAHKIDRLLVAVPSKALRDQTAEKFKHFGLLKALKVLKNEARLPVVGVATSRPKSADDLQFFRDCDLSPVWSRI